MIEQAAIQTLVIQASWITPLITGVIILVRSTFPKLPARYVPAIATGAGVLAGLFLIQLSVTGAVVGFILGLGATGLWEFGKTTVLGK